MSENSNGSLMSLASIITASKWPQRSGLKSLGDKRHWHQRAWIRCYIAMARSGYDYIICNLVGGMHPRTSSFPSDVLSWQGSFGNYPPCIIISQEIYHHLSKSCYEWIWTSEISEVQSPNCLAETISFAFTKIGKLRYYQGTEI